jgi:predicted alpha/beta hydrolase family esterase
VAVTLVPMRWLDPDETYEEKIARIDKAIGTYEDRRVVLVGESAGGAVAVASYRRFRTRVTGVVTVCGMNQGAGVVNPALYRKNRAFRDAMLASDEALPRLTAADKANMLTVYSSRDGVIGEKDTLIGGVRSVDVKVPIHMLAIGYVLFLRSNLVIKSVDY